MSLTLAQFESRILAMLYDAGAAVFSTATVDEALRQALGEYSTALPLAMETVLTLPGDGREIALNTLTGLERVTNVWWPYDTLETIWPPNRVQGFRVWWDDAQAVLFLDTINGAEPQEDDELRIWYTIAHTIQNLDSGTVTTILTPAHESAVVLGAAGYACLSRGVDVAESSSNTAVLAPNYAAMAKRFLGQFRSILNQLVTGTDFGPPFGGGWRLDEFDNG